MLRRYKGRADAGYFFFSLSPLSDFSAALGCLASPFGAFFTFHFFLALLDDFGLGWSCAFCCDDFGRLLFFDLESDHVRENLFGIGEELHLAGIDLQIACAESLIQHQAADIGF